MLDMRIADTPRGNLDCLIGNTLLDHQSLSSHIYPCDWSIKLFLRKWLTWPIERRRRTCRCGWRGSKVFAYHQAGAIIDAIEHPGRRGGDPLWVDPDA